MIPGLSASQEGQKEYLEQIIKVAREAPEGRCVGLFYWAPEYIRSADYNPGRNHLAMFDKSGNALPSIKAFKK